MKKVVSMLLSVCVLFAIFFVPAKAAVDQNQVTRLEWLTALTQTFEMSVEEDNYPDNYYSDINSSHENYYEIMLATEFGLIDVAAGEALRPDEAATREFAAHTLNLCLGYSLSEGAEYTFNEADIVTYADDIQVAINHGWFEVKNGAFLPQQAVTKTEMNAMLADASEIYHSVDHDPNHVNTYAFKEGVIVLPEATKAVLSGAEEITITDCSVTLKTGDVFAIVQDGLPVVKKAMSVKKSNNQQIVQVESVAMEDAFTDLDIQGVWEADLSQVQVANDNAKLIYVVGGTAEKNWEDGIEYTSLEDLGDQEVTAVHVISTYDIPESVRYEHNLIKGEGIEIKCTVSDVKPDFKASLFRGYAHFIVTAEVGFSCNMSLDVIEASGILKDITPLTFKFGLLGEVKIEPELSCGGSIAAVWTSDLVMGVQYSGHEFRNLSNLQKKSFTFQGEVELSVGLKISIGFDVGFLEGDLFGRVGVASKINVTTYPDGNLPTNCTHLESYLYMNVGVEVELDLGPWESSAELVYDIFSEDNSPVRLGFHWEDGEPVSICSRDDQENLKYITPINSKYGYNGASSGIGANGEVFYLFEYKLNNDGTLTITKYNGSLAALIIPGAWDGHPVVEIGSNAFKGNEELRMVSIPDSVIRIDDCAFMNCENLSSVKLSKNLQEFGTQVFENCGSLTSIEIPKSLNKMDIAVFDDDRGIFQGCYGLKKVTFEEGTSKIVSTLFANCPGIETIEIPNTVTEIELYAFYNCKNLETVTFQSTSSLREIGKSAFLNCTSLSGVTIPDSVISIDACAFMNCQNLSSVILSKKLQEFGTQVFKNCGSLTSIEIPKSLNEIGIAAFNEDRGIFQGCYGLKKVTFEAGTSKIVGTLFANCPGIETIEIPNTVTEIGLYAFYNCTNLETITFQSTSSLREIGNSAFLNCTSLSGVTIPDSVISIDACAFMNCENLSSVILSKKLQEFGTQVFKNCGSLTSIEIPKSLNAIGISAFNEDRGIFQGCYGLKNVTFEEGTSKIVSTLFANCPGIETIKIPNTVTEIELYAFYNCKNLETVTFQSTSSLREIENSAFLNCTSLSGVTIPDSVISIDASAFKNCSALSSVTLSKKLQELGNLVFENCSSLTSIKIPKSLNTVGGSGIFQGCYGLKNVTFEEGTSKIVGYLFLNCPGIETIEIPNTVTEVGKYAFNNCDSLMEITIPDSVTSLGTYAFAKCDALEDVTLGQGLTLIPSYAFDSCPMLESIVIPDKVTQINANAFTKCTGLTEVTIPRATTSIAKNVFTYPTVMTIYGFSGTYAETYADSVGAAFVSIDVPATAVSLNVETLNLNKGQTAQLILTVTPEDFTDEVSWVSENESIATVSGTGVVTANAVGETTIKVTVGDLSASCKVAVTQPVTSIALNNTSLSLETGKSETLTATVAPNDAGNKAVVWKSSNTAVATVDDAGKVTAVAVGTATITATAADGSGVSASCEVTVTEMSEQERLVRAFVERMYTIVLNRPAEEQGLADWTKRLMEKQLDGGTLVNMFVFSDEFIARNVNNEEYIKILYRAVLGREADADGLKMWKELLDGEWTRDQLKDGFVLSDEFKALCDSYGIIAVFPTPDEPDSPDDPDEPDVTELVRDFVRRMYTVVLNRPAEEQGLNDWTNRLLDGTSNGAQVADGFISSEEFANRNLSNEDYVKVLYRAFFNREADEGGFNVWMNELAKGASRRDVMKGFVHSVEFSDLCAQYGIIRGEIQ